MHACNGVLTILGSARFFGVSVKVKLSVFFIVKVKLTVFLVRVVFVCILPGKAIPEMTYTVSDATLNPTHSLTVPQSILWLQHKPLASSK